ncbi:hypothetical protein [Salsuginibacillus kocurii]|uniref:hypothetical protein n=1 Tax=Salsuginibacillus kocurii TaxID=427078 RepID=UPI000373D73B|nr:hypothetical protein [Salsuginibacillus kocurii]
MARPRTLTTLIVSALAIAGLVTYTTEEPLTISIDQPNTQSTQIKNPDTPNQPEPSTADTETLIAETTDTNFTYRIISEQSSYTSDQPVQLYAELEYTGSRDHITISHGADPFYFPLKDHSRDLELSYWSYDTDQTTTLEKEKPIRVSIDRDRLQPRSGSQSSDARTLLEDIREGEDFPPGEYNVKGQARFQVPDKDHQLHSLETELTFTVHDGV